MTGLNLTPLIAAVPLGDDNPVVVRRWMVLAFVPVFMAVWGYIYSIDVRVTRLQSAPVVRNEQVEELRGEIAALRNLIDDRRATRNGEFSGLKSDVANVQRELEQMRKQMDSNFERLLYGRRSNGE